MTKKLNKSSDPRQRARCDIKLITSPCLKQFLPQPNPRPICVLTLPLSVPRPRSLFPRYWSYSDSSLLITPMSSLTTPCLAHCPRLMTMATRVKSWSGNQAPAHTAAQPLGLSGIKCGDWRAGDSGSEAASLDKSQSIQDNSRSARNVERMEECARSISQSQIRPMVISIIQVEIKISQPQIVS